MSGAFTGQTFPNATVAFTNAAGAPAPVDGVPVWASSDETVLLVVAADDGMSAVVSTVATGTARITVNADADIGDGVQGIIGASDDVVVTENPNGMASVVTLDLGTAVDN
jgi:hypothetical protein